MPSKLTQTRRRRATRRMFIHAAELVDSGQLSGCCGAIIKASRVAGFRFLRRSAPWSAFGDLFSPTLAELASTYGGAKYRVFLPAKCGHRDARGYFSYWMGPNFSSDGSAAALRRAREIRVLALLFAAEVIGGES